ncbi:MAG: Eco57I restriction-modification methylase domain-containing protein, partial [Promethearchaeota archaeon]
MDLKNLRVDELTQNLWKNRENPQMKPDIWFHFLNLFFNKPIIEKFEASDDLLIGNVSILGKINELIILFIQEDNNLRSVIKACNELSKKVITSKFKDCQLLALNPCNSGLKILFFSSFVNGSINRVKLIHFQQGRVPRYFQELIESDDNTNPILSLQRLIDASSMKMSLMNYINRAFTHLSKDKIIAFLALLLYYSIFIPYNDFSDWLQTKSKDSDEFTLMYYLSELHEYMNQKHIENLESIEIDSILQEFDNILIDSVLFQDILYSFPFTLTEPTAFFQEIAINPTILSDLAEELAISSSKKKEGKYYTSESNADFISNIAVFRMLSNKLTGMEANDLYKWVYQDWGFEFEPFVFSLDQLSTTHSCLKILDPACGSGTFLLSVTRLLSRLAISLVSSCEKFFPIVELIGIDPDKIALLVTRLRLNFFKLQELTDILSSDPTGRTDSPFRLDFRYIQGDFLVHPKIYDQKYDLILGNPPWIRHEDIGASHAPGYKNLIRTQIKKFSGENTFFDWKSDLYVYFSL